MITIPLDQIPELPTQDILAGECVAFGIVDTGILIHYLEKDLARLVTWEDIILLGLRDPAEILENSKSAEKENDGVKEIPGPVVP